MLMRALGLQVHTSNGHVTYTNDKHNNRPKHHMAAEMKWTCTPTATPTPPTAPPVGYYPAPPTIQPFPMPPLVQQPPSGCEEGGYYILPIPQQPDHMPPPVLVRTALCVEVVTADGRSFHQCTPLTPLTSATVPGSVLDTPEMQAQRTTAYASAAGAGHTASTSSNGGCMGCSGVGVGAGPGASGWPFWSSNKGNDQSGDLYQQYHGHPSGTMSAGPLSCWSTAKC